jgi:NAD(P)H-hydrate repair Nnr-like enzyme with NAD(P)H-hydrate epimerase domain
MCKLKLFEAYVRARNLAGDEARVGLVCMAKEPKKIEQEMVRSWDVEGKVRVWGHQHLPKFSEQLVDWFAGTGS